MNPHYDLPPMTKEPESTPGMLWDSNYQVEVNPERLDEYLERFGDEGQQEEYKLKYIS